MPATKPTYDLVLMLDPSAEDDVRAKALTDARAQIEASGELVLEQDWGMRGLAYQIDHREQAEYHLLQLHGEAALIDSLERSLRIADGVLRHRIIKLDPGTPAPPEHAPPRPAAAAPSATPAPAPTPELTAEPAAEPAPEPAAEAAAEAAAEPDESEELTPA